MSNDARKIFNSNLIRIMESEHKTQSDISRDLNIPLSTISSWVNGASYPRVDKMQILADYLNVSMKNLTDEQIYESANVEYISVPLYAAVSCGTGSFVDDEVLQNIAVPSEGLSKNAEYFAQYADGESMRDVGINDGDLLVFEKTSSPTNGMIGCFCVDYNTSVCKQFRSTANGIMLMPKNSNYDPIHIDPELNHFVCLGKLRKVIKSF